MFIPQGWRLDLVGIDPSQHWGVMAGLARRADANPEWESIWVYDHFHTTPVATAEATHEAWTLMAAFAGVTGRVRLGQMCTCMSYRNPAYLAKVAATVDIVSEGRVEMGIGAGWYEQEWRAYGYGFPTAGERLARLREGVDIFVNARIDVYLFKLVPPAEAVAESLRRARIYQDAGASGIFVPAIVAPDDIRTVAAAVERPLNVLAWPGLPPAAELAKLGVKRLSAGSGIAKAVWGRTAALAKSFLQDGAYQALAEGAMDSATANGLYSK